MTILIVSLESRDPKGKMKKNIKDGETTLGSRQGLNK